VRAGGHPLTERAPGPAVSAAESGTGTIGGAGRPTRAELVALGAVLALAAVLRFAWLPTRGQFDADQGHDMLVLRGMVVDGVLPLLGPPTSVGAGHHGALYYYLLAPAAALNGAADPVPVIAFIALLGILAVGLTWWLARSIAGPVAGVASALVLAVSASSVETSTFLWNPNPIPAASALALVGARIAWMRRSARWWLVAALGAMVAMQCHWLASLLVPPLAALWLVDLGRSGPGARRRSLLAAGAGSLAILALGFVPLAIHEASTGGEDVRAIAAWIAGGGDPASLSAPTRVAIAFLRTIGWPIGGLVTDAPLASALALLLVAAVVAWRVILGRGDERAMVAWLGGTLGFAAVALGLLFPSSTIVVPLLPVDHYHAFLDPVVAALVGIGIGAMARGFLSGRSAGIVGVAAAAAILVAIVGWNLATQRPATSALGDWGAARAAADRIIADAGADGEIGLVWLPGIKSPDAIGYPLTVSGRPPADPLTAGTVAVVCDDPFVDDCAGAAELRGLDGAGGAASFDMVDRFTPSPGRTVTVYVRRTPG
jgi:hypothetical protein